MRTLQQNNHIQTKSDHLDKCFLIFRPFDFPLFLKPIRVRGDTICAITGKTIEGGQFAYPCYENPIRLSPYGPSKCHIGAAIHKGNSILPSGYYAAPVPTTEYLKSKVTNIEAKKSLQLNSATVKALIAGKINKRK